MLTAKALEDSGVEVDVLFEAENGKEALSVLDEYDVDLAFVDLNMPVMNGIEFLDRLNQSERLAEIPVIMVTSEGQADWIERIKVWGVGYLQKPVKSESIKQAVEDVISRQSETLVEIVPDVLRKLAGITLESRRDGYLPVVDRILLCGRIRFFGPVEGELTVVMPFSVCGAISSKLAGCNGKACDESLTVDILKELVNVICGRVLTATRKEGPACRVMSPQVEFVGVEDWYSLLGFPDTEKFVVGDWPVLVRFATTSTSG